MSNIVQTKRKYVADIIGDDYKNWTNENIIINAGTGTGKTTFIIDNLCDYAVSKNKKVLYLYNRRKLGKDIREKIKKYGDRVNVMAYQTLEEKVYDDDFDIKFDYIIADECHYFTSDSMFNYYTDVVYHYLQEQASSIVVYMSATASQFFTALMNQNKVFEEDYYCIPKNYDYVDNIYFFEQKDDYLKIIKSILSKMDCQQEIGQKL